MRAVTGFVLGAGVAYYLDPDNGTRRRRLFLDRGARVVRRGWRTTGKKARYTKGRLRGVVAEAQAAASTDVGATDDETVLQRIRSQTLRDAGLSTTDIDVDVRDGIATVRGTVPSTELADDLVARVRDVPGVVDVRSQVSIALYEGSGENG